MGLGTTQFVSQVLPDHRCNSIGTLTVEAVDRGGEHSRQCRLERPVVDGVLAEIADAQLARLPPAVEGVSEKRLPLE